MVRLGGAFTAFERHALPEPMSGCWLWMASVNNRGYGLLQTAEFKGYAHRFSYREFCGEIPAGMHVCHRCDTPSCVNPSHLFLGSAQDNMRDCVRKGRHASRNPKTRYAKGVRCARAKLSEDNVRSIRALRGTASQRDLARRFGVTKNAIKLILQNKTWRHVDIGAA